MFSAAIFVVCVCVGGGEGGIHCFFVSFGMRVGVRVDGVLIRIYNFLGECRLFVKECGASQRRKSSDIRCDVDRNEGDEGRGRGKTKGAGSDVVRVEAGAA